jgi:putative tryptophan/tyrosine transport system substrate-binding protein
VQTQKSRIGNLAIALFVMTLPWPDVVEAQQPGKIPRIGFLGARSAFQIGDSTNAFRQGLSEFGYIEGKNIVIEYRWAEGKSDRLPELAAELVRLKVDVIVAAGGTPGMLAAKNATSTIPIVFTGVLTW